MQLSTTGHKAVVIGAAVIIVALNVAAIAIPALHANISPNALALINSALAGAVALLHALRQEGIITDAEVPGLSAVLGPATVAGDLNVTVNNPPSDAPAVSGTTTSRKESS